MVGKNRYERLIEAIFFHHYEPGCTWFTFEREELERFAAELNIRLPKNLGDVVYTFRYRSELPVRVSETCATGMTWYILPAGKGRYRFEMQPEIDLQPNPNYGKINRQKRLLVIPRAGPAGRSHRAARPRSSVGRAAAAGPNPRTPAPTRR